MDSRTATWDIRPGVQAAFRLNPDHRGEYVAREVVVIATERLTAADLRAISLAHVEAMVNGTDPALSYAIRRPDKRDVDQFYRGVARAYRAASAASSHPAVAISKASDVPVRTVHGWISEARRRGHLPSGAKGRRG